MKSLFDQTQLAGIKLKNRLVRSATYDGLADERGHISEELFRVYENLAEGGVGTIITGFTYVSELEEPLPRQMGIYDDSFIDEYQKLTAMNHQYDTRMILQLTCLGSQTIPSARGRRMWGPGAVEDSAYKTRPQQMCIEEIQIVQTAFAAAAERAKQAGFDGVQIQAAHGFLLSKFLTPYYNRRSDSYGGTIENRARMILETVRAIRDKVGPEYPVLMKINCEDFMDQGMTFGECRYVCKELAQTGVDAIEISGGSQSSWPEKGVMRKIPPEEESYFKSYAAVIADEINIPVILVGGNRDFTSLTEILNQTPIEYFALSRPLVYESDLINRWQSGDLNRAKCISCNQCFRIGGTHCVYNPN